MKWTIYSINLQGEVKYIGKTNNFKRRKIYHLRYQHLKQSAIPDGTDLSLISFNIIGEFDQEEEAYKIEDKLICQYNTINNGWNTRRSGLIWKDRKSYRKMQHEIHKDSDNKKNLERYYNNRERYLEVHRKYKNNKRKKEVI